MDIECLPQTCSSFLALSDLERYGYCLNTFLSKGQRIATTCPRMPLVGSSAHSSYCQGYAEECAQTPSCSAWATTEDLRSLLLPSPGARQGQPAADNDRGRQDPGERGSPSSCCQWLLAARTGEPLPSRRYLTLTGSPLPCSSCHQAQPPAQDPKGRSTGGTARGAQGKGRPAGKKGGGAF